MQLDSYQLGLMYCWTDWNNFLIIDRLSIFNLLSMMHFLFVCFGQDILSDTDRQYVSSTGRKKKTCAFPVQLPHDSLKIQRLCTKIQQSKINQSSPLRPVQQFCVVCRDSELAVLLCASWWTGLVDCLHVQYRSNTWTKLNFMTLRQSIVALLTVCVCVCAHARKCVCVFVCK